MDDLTFYEKTFDDYLLNLKKFLKRHIKKNQVLNQEEYHFMTTSRVIYTWLIRKNTISREGIKVDLTKIELIEKIPTPTIVKEMR